MRNIVVDFEMNEVSEQYTEERQLCKFEIIEIGAIMLDENYEELDSFKTFVKPQYNDEILPIYTELTGIDTQMVKDAPVFKEAFKSFVDWCVDDDEEINVFAWSGSDLIQIKKEMTMKKYKKRKSDKKVIANWFDFQKIYTEKLGVDHAISLEKALTYAGLDFEGQQHDALFDARNTASLVAIANDETKFEDMLGSVSKALKGTEITNTLGDLFDFSQFL